MFDIDGVEMLDFQPPSEHDLGTPSQSLKPPFSLEAAASGWAVVNGQGKAIVVCIDYHVARFTVSLFNLADLYGAKTLKRYGKGTEE